MIFNATKINITDFSFSVFPPKDRLQEWRHIANILKTKYNNFAQIKIDKPFKLRSTGYKSQNHHLHGHIRQIAGELGYNNSEIKNYIKSECSEWPLENVLGKAVPKSEAKLSSAEEAAAIEFCHRLAAENNIILIEDD